MDVSVDEIDPLRESRAKVEEVRHFLDRSRGMTHRLRSHVARVHAHLTGSGPPTVLTVEGRHAQIDGSPPASLTMVERRRPLRAGAPGGPLTVRDGARVESSLAVLPILENAACSVATVDVAPRGALLATTLVDLELAREALEDARRLLAREHAKFWDAFDHDSAPSVMTDATGRVREANQAAGETFGMASHRMRGRLLLSFVARGDTWRLRDFTRSLWTDLASVETRTVLANIRPRGGRVAPAQFSVRAVEDLYRRRVCLRWTVVFRDG